MMEARVIKTEVGYCAALAEVERLLDATAPADLDRLELFSVLVENYETTHFPMPYPDPLEAIRFRMEQQGLASVDLAPIMGGKNRVSEVLSRKRPLSLKMIRSLHRSLHIPYESLISSK